MTLEDATRRATALRDALAPFCVPGHCVIAGSVRREKPDPNDIELVVLPILNDWEKVDGFRKLLASNKFGRVKKGQFPGRQIVLNDGHSDIELYIQSRESYGLNVWIRTGPAEYCARGLAFWKTVTEGGYSEGAVLHLADGTPVPTLTEISVFQEFDRYAKAYANKKQTSYVPVKWIEPRNRK